MAQNSYLTNLLGINPSGVGQTRYEYTLPIFNELLSKGLSEDQISGYDKNFGIFNQFPYKTKPNPQQDYAQYEVVPQVEGQVPVEEEENEDTEVEIDYSQTQNNENKTDTVSTQKYGTIRDNVPETLNISGVPLNDMTENELLEFGQRKGYIGENGTLLGPMQVNTKGVPPGLLSLSATALKSPIQGLNDKAYERFTTALQKKKMFLGDGERFGENRQQFADFSNAYKKQLNIANAFNSNLSLQGTTGQIKIPGTFKSVNAVLNQYVPSGKDDNEVIYKTGTGGHYRNDGKFVTAYGQVARHGSMTDAIDVLTAAGQSGNLDSIPDKFDQAWVNKMNKAKTVSKEQRDQINDAWKNINKTSNTNKSKQKFIEKSSEQTQSSYEQASSSKSTNSKTQKKNKGGNPDKQISKIGNPFGY
jgi:hypothetical protein